jgi:hypothetical protein
MKVIAVLLWLAAASAAAKGQGPVFVTLYDFAGGADGAMGGRAGAPNGVIVGKNGNLFGTTYAGGANSCGSYRCGTVYVLTPSAAGPWKKTVLHNFNGTDGALPAANQQWAAFWNDPSGRQRQQRWDRIRARAAYSTGWDLDRDSTV